LFWLGIVHGARARDIRDNYPTNILVPVSKHDSLTL
jgi:hypothetical protein